VLDLQEIGSIWILLVFAEVEGIPARGEFLERENNSFMKLEMLS
jgi:hypothetical protein